MDKDRKLRLETAMAIWKEKGNARLAEACAEALEAQQAKTKKDEPLNS